MTELSPSLRGAPDLDDWIRIEPDGRVTVFTGKVEIGQGIATALARIAAEELDVPLDRIEVVTGDTARTPNELFTAGSMSIESSGGAIRSAAAEARQVLLERAASHLAAPIETLRTEGGAVLSENGERAPYGNLMGGRSFERAVTGEAPTRAPREYRLVGKPGPRLDLGPKVVGAPAFVHDLDPADLVHARVVRPPGPGARLTALDTADVESRAGVLAVVRDGSFVGVVALREEQAARAADALRRAAKWSTPPALPDPTSLPALLEGGATESLLVVEGVPVDDPIPPIVTPPGAATTLEADYFRPFQMHASLGPSAALARVDGEALTVWTHSQGVFPLRAALARVLEVEPERVRVIHAEGAGCYGHNGADDAALDAALLARAVPGRAVRLQWTREDEHAWEPYAPAMYVRTRASLDATGRLLDWNLDVWSPTHVGRPLPWPDASGLLAAWHLEKPLPRPEPRAMRVPHGGIHRNADPLYATPTRRIVKHLVAESPFRTSSTRSLGAYANVFAIESFMDELALAADADPVEFRLRHMEDPRARAVVEAAAEGAGWRSGGGGEGRGRGMGFARYKNEKCLAAVVIDLEVDGRGRIVLHRALIAADAGRVIDPDGLTNQLEGGLIQAASWTLKEAVRFDPAGVTSRDWETYPILTFSEVPEVETVLLDRPEEPPLGAGEATQGPTAAAIANAVFHATGARLRQIPFTPDRVLQALLADAAGAPGRSP